MNAGYVFSAAVGTVVGVAAGPAFPADGIHLTGGTAVVVATLAACGAAAVLAPAIRWVRDRYYIERIGWSLNLFRHAAVPGDTVAVLDSDPREFVKILKVDHDRRGVGGAFIQKGDNIPSWIGCQYLCPCDPILVASIGWSRGAVAS